MSGADDAGSTPPFATRLIAWQHRHGRHDLPWQGTRDAYRIWLSEIMLQQTQVQTVIPYYERFLDRFPDVAALAAASLDDVLALWSGLGYYSRARNLHAAARGVAMHHGDVFPRDLAALEALPGIGRSTAAAIAAFSAGTRAAIMDGNVQRVLSRHFAIDSDPGAAATRGRLWSLAESLLPQSDIAAYTQGLMDLGATVCTRSRPRCADCPLLATCLAHLQGRTAELPAKRHRKIVPERQVWLAVLIDNDGVVLLERRPENGIWGGLWSLPELADGEDAPSADALAAACRRHGASPSGSPDPMPALRHAFTHFRLHMHPLRIAVTQLPGASEPGRMWLPPNDALAKGIPTPVRRLLTQLRADMEAAALAKPHPAQTGALNA